MNPDPLDLIRPNPNPDLDNLEPPAPLARTTMRTTNGPVEGLLCEPVGAHLALVPTFWMDRHGHTRLSGRYAIVHTPSGMALSDGDGCIACARHHARHLASTDADWGDLTADNTRDWSAALTPDAKVAVSMYRALAFGCDAEDCGPWPCHSEEEPPEEAL
jgi:hypothetical protein